MATNEGNWEQAKHHHQSAIQNTRQATLMAPTMGYALLYSVGLNAAYLKLGNIEDCRQLTVLFPKKAKVFYRQGRVKAALGDYTGAITDFERVIALKPDYALAYYAQGLAKQALGQHDAAAFDFAKARVLNPDVDKLYPFSYGGIE